MGIHEPCQVGNEAALRGTSYVPRVSRIVRDTDDYGNTVFLFGGSMANSSLIETAYSHCTLCPRKCGANRLNGEKGVCGMTSSLYVSRAALHMWEEPCISGKEGSGTVFFSGCPLHCVFCQNHDISGGISGKEISVERLGEIFIELQKKGANNINLVTPTHYIPHIVEAANQARKNGLTIPFVYNTSGYETEESLELLKDTVDIFLPDFKYFSTDTSSLLSKAQNYTEVAKRALAKMYEIVGKPLFDDESGMMKKGVIVRVLVLPLHTNEAIKIVRYLHETYADNIYISIMTQYTPIEDTLPTGSEYDFLRRSITKREYEKVINACLELGLKNAFFQDGKANLESFIPPFDNEGV